LFGHIANSKITPIETIGFMPQSKDNEIIGGARRTPSKLNIYTIPAAVD